MMKNLKTMSEFETVVSSNPRVIVDFYADWCGPCKMLGPVFEEVANELTDTVFVKVNVDENPEVTQKFGVTTIPTLISFKDGEKFEQSVGFMPKPNLVKFVTNLK